MFNARLVTALALLAGCIAALLFLPNRWWAALLLLVLAVAGWEWGTLAGIRPARRWLYVGFVLGSACVIGLIAESTGGIANRHSGVETAIYGASTGFWLLLALPWLTRQWQVRSRLALGAAGWMALVPAWLAVARLQL